MMRLSALLVLAQGVHQAAAARVQVNMSELEGVDVACYCQEVESMEECPDNKHRTEPERCDGPRYFHAGEQGKKSLCCKLEETSMFNFVGWAYTKQEKLDLCNKEVRVLPEATCCQLQDGSRGSIAVRVKSAKSEARAGNSYGVPLFFKSSPIVQLEDITSAEDYSGAEVSRGQLQAFLESKHFTPSKLECLGTMEALFADQRKDCRLRETTTRHCCCNAASLTRAVRCLPVEGAATEAEAAPLYLDAKVKSTKEHGYIKDTVYHPSHHEAGDMPELLEDLADPEQQDLPETPMDEASMLFSWAKTGQWSASCSRWGDINVVKTRKETKKVPNGEHCVSRKVGLSYQRHCTKKYKQTTTYHYSQGKETGVCLQRKWERNCPAGHGAYKKKIDPGTCMGEDSGLQEVAALSYACPAGYRGEEEEHSDLEQCKCQTDCS